MLKLKLTSKKFYNFGHRSLKLSFALNRKTTWISNNLGQFYKKFYSESESLIFEALALKVPHYKSTIRNIDNKYKAWLEVSYVDKTETWSRCEL